MAKVHVSLPAEFLQDLDEHATALLMSRSSYIRVALIEKMNRSLAKLESNDMEPYVEQLRSLDTQAPDTMSPRSL